MKAHIFHNVAFEKLVEKLHIHKAQIEDEIMSSDYNEKQFYLLKGKHSLIDDIIQVIIQEDLDIGG